MDLPLSVYQDRLLKIRESMSKRELDVLVISSIKKNTVKYLSGFTQPNFLQSLGNCLLIVPQQGNATLIVQAVPFGRKGISQQTWIEDIRLGPSFAAVLEQCVKVLKEMKLDTGCIGLVGREIDNLIEMYLKSYFPKAEFKDANLLHDALRMFKCPEEVALLRKIQEICDIKFKAAMEATKVGKTEYEVIAAAEYAGRVLGAERSTSDLIGCAPEENPRLVRPPTFRKISPKEVVLFEAIPFFKGYNVELIGVFVPGEVSKEQEEISNLCFKAHQAGLAVAKPGAKIAEIHRAALEMVQQAGYEGFTHSLGHGIGLDNGEKPDFTPQMEDSPVLKPGMVFAYHANISGSNVPKATFGCVMLVNETGVEPLTKIVPQPLYYL